MSRYAEGTDVSPSRSQQEIDSTLTRFGATSRAFATEPDRVMVAFLAEGRQVRVILHLPPENDPEFVRSGQGNRTRVRTLAQRKAAHAAEIRRLWRSLALTVKAKMDAIDSGIETFEEAWLAHIVLPDQTTVADHVIPGISEAYRTGVVRPFIPLPKAIEGGQ